jgi:ABC-type lipoprotein export system ATPase subunit
MHDSSWTGEYHFLDYPIHAMKKKGSRRVYKKYFGFVFQSYHLLDSLTVYENLEIPLSYRNVRKSERDAAVCDVLDRFQMVGKKDLFPNQLSGGQQQLVGVARAIIANPKVILADEPTGNLHSQSGQGDHGGVQETQRIRHHHHSGDAFGVECFLRKAGDPDRRRVD